MSTQYYSTMPRSYAEAIKIAASVGWRLARKDGDQLLTDGEYFVRDLAMIRVGKKPFCFTFTRYNTNDCESLVEALDAWSEHDNALVNCDNCGNYMWESDMRVTKDESVVCLACFHPPATKRELARQLVQDHKLRGLLLRRPAPRDHDEQDADIQLVKYIMWYTREFLVRTIEEVNPADLPERGEGRGGEPTK